MNFAIQRPGAHPSGYPRRNRNRGGTKEGPTPVPSDPGPRGRYHQRRRCRVTARKVRATMDPDFTRLNGHHASSSEPHLTVLDDIARHVDGAFVVVVELTAGQYRRRCFLTARAAEAAARRATDRGETATVYLAELKPLWKVRGGEVR